MSQPRLVLFIFDVEANLTALRKTLRHLCDEAGMPPPECDWMEGAEALTDAGWQVAELLPPQGVGRKPSAQAMDLMEEHLDLLVQAVARDMKERVVGLFTDRASSYARVCASGPGRPTKAIEGEYLDVLRQGARWLEVESTSLARLVGGAHRNVLAASVDFGNEPARAPQPPPEPDEDDRFVEARLAEARELMQRYLSAAQRK